MKLSAKIFFDKYSKQYDEVDKYKNPHYRWLVNKIINQINKEKSKVLDFGTGTGELAIRISKKFPKTKVIGIDISNGMIREARKKINLLGIKNIRFIVSPVEKLKINNADFVVSVYTFHHVKNKELVISKIYKILPKHGKLIIGDGFKPSKEYKKEIEKLRRKNPKKAKEFDKKNEASGERSKQYMEEHPKEYHVYPTELKQMMKDSGFSKQKILKSLSPKIAVVIGEK